MLVGTDLCAGTHGQVLRASLSFTAEIEQWKHKHAALELENAELVEQKERWEAQAAHNLGLMQSAQDELRAANATVLDLLQQLSASHAMVQALENRSISATCRIDGISNALEEMRRELCRLPETLM